MMISIPIKIALNITESAYRQETAKTSLPWFVASDAWYEAGLEELGDICQFVGYAFRHSFVTRITLFKGYTNCDPNGKNVPPCIEIAFKNKYFQKGTYVHLGMRVDTYDILRASFKDKWG